MQKTALITGITGQDGSFLAELLLEKGYAVHGIIRRASSFNTHRIEHLYFSEWIKDVHLEKKVQLHYGDITDSTSLIRILQEDVFYDTFDWIDKINHAIQKIIENKIIQNIFICKNNEYDIFNDF